MYRPLSPHLLIHKPQFSSVFSIFHRVTGVVSAMGTLFIWLRSRLTFTSPSRAHYAIYLTSRYPNTYSAWASVAALSIIISSLLYHTSSGVRHLVWDFYGPRYSNKAAVIKSAYFILIIPVTAFVTSIIKM